jgi:hypothetical protein
MDRVGQHGRRPDREVINMETNVQYVKDHTATGQLFNHIIKNDKLGKLQLFFDAGVLEAYNNTDAFKIIRTDTSGRVSKKGVWAVDFGISAEEKLIHITVESFIHQVPEAEQEHWMEYMVTLPASKNFLKGVVRPGCIDDGSIRNW